MDTTLKSFESKKGNTITFRHPEEGDVDILLDFINALIDEDIYIQLHGKHVTREHEEEYVKNSVSDLKAKNAVHVLAFHNNVLVGNASIIKGKHRHEHIGLFGIALAKDYRGEGIGEKLTEYVLSQVSSINIQMVELKVYHPNDAAINLYKKLGFKEIGRFPGGAKYKDDYIDEIWMVKEL